MNKHLEKIQASLLDGEQIISTVAGTITPPGSASGTVRGMLVLTDRRFLFNGAAWGSKTSRSFLLSQVTSIDLHKNLMLAHIQVTMAGGYERFLVKYNDAEVFVAAAHRQLATRA